MKTAVISVYFGAPPDYFPLTLASMGSNDGIDFFIIGDINPPAKYPRNVRFIKLSMQEIKALIESKMEFQVSLETPYKLCDFKPSYGLLFSEYLSGYDYWGMCDLDLVFGQIQPVVTKWQDNGVERIFKRGHFMLIRNCDRNNLIFQNRDGLKYDYKQVFQSPKNYLFDERGYNHIWTHSELSQHDAYIVADIFPHRKVFQLSPTHGKFNGKCQYFVWTEGQLIQVMNDDGQFTTRQWAYMHMQKRKIRLVDDVEFEGRYIFYPNEIIRMHGEFEHLTEHLQTTGYHVSTDLGLTTRRWKEWIKNRMGSKIAYETAGKGMD